jgi:cytochrome c oxidase subunit IV
MADPQPTHSHEADHGAHAHPGPKFYILIGVVLTVLTALEVAVFYIPALQAALVPILLVLTAGKFGLVVMFYMHLKFDSRIFSWVFIAPLVLAIAVVISLIILFKVLPGFNPV